MWQEYFTYDETSPSCLRWKISGGSIQAGDIAGTVGGQVYYRVQLKRKLYTVHRIIWEMYNGEIEEGSEIDHFDLNKTNNKLSNLRKASKSINCRNRPLRIDSKSGISGVSRRVQRGYVIWVGRYVDYSGKRVNKNFSVLKYGEDNAKELAIAAVAAGRADAANNYTDLHGSKGK